MERDEGGETSAGPVRRHPWWRGWWRRWWRGWWPHRAGRRRSLAPWPSLADFGPRPDGGAVVGGAVRDALLGRTPRDVDWVVPDPERAARDLAARTGGSLVALDPARGHWRVVRPDATTGPEIIDLAPLQGTLRDDLARRDLTIDAIAIGPDGPLDPHGGEADLAAGRIRRVRAGAIFDDPVRAWRAVRLQAELEAGFDAATREEVAALAAALRAGRVPLPAPERVATELVRWSYAPAPGDAWLQGHALGLVELHLPELAAGDGVLQGGLHHLDVLRHQCEALQRLVSAFPQADEALRWAALLHDVAKPACRSEDPGGRVRFDGHAREGARIVERRLRALRVPGAVRTRAAALVAAHMVPLPQGERAARRFVHRRRALLPDLLALMLADREAARGPLASAAGRRAYRVGVARVLAVAEESPAPSRPLLDGKEVMAHTGLAPGPAVGEALAFLADAHAVGDVRDRDEAVAALTRFVAARARRETQGS